MTSCESKLEKMTDKEYVKRAVKNNFPSPDSIVLKDVTGSILTTQEMISLYERGGYTTDFFLNGSGEIVEALIRRSTPKDQKLEAEINRKMNAGPPVTISEIDCDKITPLLEEAFRRDQVIRTESEEYDDMVDHKNLVLVMSIEQQCGLPEGEKYKREVGIIWTIIQHSGAQYRKRYMSYFEKAHEEQTLDAQSIALMKDRMLMDNGKPQIYGSQLYNGQLYNLREPETVDKRRASVGLEPISQYLDRFGLTFDIPQE